MKNKNNIADLFDPENYFQLSDSDRVKYLDIRRITKNDSRKYLNNLRNLLNEGLDEVVETIEGGSLTGKDLVKALSSIRNLIHQEGYETILSYVFSNDSRINENFKDRDNIYQLTIRKKKSFLERMFG
ncbi:MAG TPA: hypothetical protein HA283_01415 [Nanoarchaeota archaeon]|nr:hypothetical protein [Nanoarchaeota archaeon]HIH62931.1 hypothetical protein [Nanoarchaeota archaeon]HIJ10372.1 hypothetical protein [Nanoarchaeota archaeon]